MILVQRIAYSKIKPLIICLLSISKLQKNSCFPVQYVVEIFWTFGKFTYRIWIHGDGCMVLSISPWSNSLYHRYVIFRSIEGCSIFPLYYMDQVPAHACDLKNHCHGNTWPSASIALWRRNCDVMQSVRDYNVALRDWSLSNVNLVGEKSTSFHKCVRWIESICGIKARNHARSIYKNLWTRCWQQKDALGLWPLASCILLLPAPR